MAELTAVFCGDEIPAQCDSDTQYWRAREVTAPHSWGSAKSAGTKTLKSNVFQF